MEAIEKFIEVFMKNTNFIFLSIVFGFLGSILNPRNRTIWAYLISLVTAISLGMVLGFYLEESGVKESVAYMIVALVSVIAKDLIELLLVTIAHVNTKSSQIVDGVIKKFLDKNGE